MGAGHFVGPASSNSRQWECRNQEIVELLLSWFDVYGRELPWRHRPWNHGRCLWSRSWCNRRGRRGLLPPFQRSLHLARRRPIGADQPCRHLAVQGQAALAPVEPGDRAPPASPTARVPSVEPSSATTISTIRSRPDPSDSSARGSPVAAFRVGITTASTAPPSLPFPHPPHRGGARSGRYVTKRHACHGASYAWLIRTGPLGHETDVSFRAASPHMPSGFTGFASSAWGFL